jgi:sodium transport system permease protein
MSWHNVKLIFLREVRDQLRDRRTLFMIAVLPMLLYPLMGMVMLQVLQFRREHPTRIWLIGSENLPGEPKLIEGNRFAEASESKLVELTVTPQIPEDMRASGPREQAEAAIQKGEYDAVVYFPSQFAEELEKFRQQIRALNETGAPDITEDKLNQVPKPEVFANTASDKSKVALERLEGVLYRWRQQVVQKNLEARHVPKQATAPFEVVNTDFAEETSRRAAIWSRILPFVVLIWALTGAFYPAIDLCAGEKERGTLETLLSSPAQRGEIVWGKLLTVMTFSMTTSLLNLASLAGTSGFVISQMSRIAPNGAGMEIGPPPLAALPWLIVALIPLSALFSALSLAVAAFAKSSKEGQYYLMPLLLFTLPLMLFPMMPATELELGTAIIPVTGVVFLLRALMEGQYWEAARFALPVIGVTTVCCLLAVRWAIDQFNNESVLFRESERWDLGLWLRHLVRDREETPSVGEAILCGVLILVARFFATFAANSFSSATPDFRSFATITVITLVALVATPALLMTVMLTSNPRKTLSLYWPRWQMLPFAVLLAVLVHPVAAWLSIGIQELYPLSADAKEQLHRALAPLGEVPIWQQLLLIAVVPAICEELAFRGFILSGLRHTGHRWVAIAASAVFFGITHSLLQQSLSAAILGLVIGYIVLRTGSLLTGVLFHLTHNGLMLLVPYTFAEISQTQPWTKSLLELGDDGLLYHPVLAIACGLAAAGMLYWLHRQPYAANAEERLQQALDHQTPLAAKPQWKLW